MSSKKLYKVILRICNIYDIERERRSIFLENGVKITMNINQGTE